jgi:hypothetical protein
LFVADSETTPTLTTVVAVQPDRALVVANSTCTGAVDAVQFVSVARLLSPANPPAITTPEITTLAVSPLIILTVDPATSTGELDTLVVVPAVTPLDLVVPTSIQVRAITKSQTLTVTNATRSSGMDTCYLPGLMSPSTLTASRNVTSVVAVVDSDVAILKATTKFVIITGATPERASLALGLYIGPGGTLTASLEHTIIDQMEGTLTTTIEHRVYEIGTHSTTVTYLVAAFGTLDSTFTFTVSEIHYGTVTAYLESRVYEAPTGSAGTLTLPIKFCTYSINHLFFT